MIRTMTHKLIRRSSGHHELYDLQADPHELVNVYGRTEHAEVERRLLERMLDWYIHTADVVPFDTDPRGWSP